MIRELTIMRPAADAATYEKLAGFFSILGFEPGQGWKDKASRGASFLAPVGNLEFVESAAFRARLAKNEAASGAEGAQAPSFELWIEVTGLDDIERMAGKWLDLTWGQNESQKRATAIEETRWKSRSFTVEPVPGYAFTFWEWLDPLKNRPAALEGHLNAQGMRFAIVVSRWNAVITDRLLQGALDALLRSGAARSDIQVIRVPGAWEIPSAARKAAETAQVEAILALGVLLRGETAHYEAIYNEVSRGIGQSQQETGLPHAFGVLTCDTLEQALNRAGLKAGNKGFETAMAAIEMVSLHREMNARRQPATAHSRMSVQPE